MSIIPQIRETIEALYDGVCTVIELQDVTNPVTKITKKKEVENLVDQPCRLSYQGTRSTSPTSNGADEKAQSIKLFIAPDVVINPGSKIIITQNETTEEYTRSGVPSIYQSHQEISLELFERWP